MRANNLTRKADPLMLLVAAVVLAAVMSTAVQAAEPFQFNPQQGLTSLAAVFDESGYRVTTLGHSGTGLHVSMSPPSGARESYFAGAGTRHNPVNMSDIYLSIRLPW